MLYRTGVVLLLVVLSSGCQTQAESVPPLVIDVLPPAGGVGQFKDALAAFRAGKGAKGFSEVVDARGAGFSRAIRITTVERGEPWDVTAGAPIPEPVAKDDVLLLIFWARTLQTKDESGQGVFRASVGMSARPWSKSLQQTLSVGSEWQQFFLPFESRDSYAAGGMGIELAAGQVVQSLEFGGIELLSYDRQLSVGDLPRTRPTYVGREPDARWRAAAEERIRRLRMAPITVRVVDPAGRPVHGAQVHIQMTRHAFQFGCAVTVWDLVNAADPRNTEYQQKLLELFNAMSFGNCLKWPAWAGDWGEKNSREVALRGLKWAKEHDLTFRGHVLVWPSWGHLPRFMQKYREHPDPSAIEQDVLKHIDDETTATRGYVAEWDVINEPYDNHDLMDICGRQVMVDWFKHARQNLPEARLALNDYGVLTTLTNDLHQDSYEENIRYLLKGGAPLTVLGMQGHFGSSVPSPERILATLDRFAKFGLPIRITEFTIGTDDPDLQADFTRDFLTVLFSHPSAMGFQFWGSDQLFTQDLKDKPIAAAYRDVVLHRWWTDTTGNTDAAGLLSGQGFLGKYRVSVTRAGQTVVQDLELTKTSGPLIVTMPGD
jgi:GH35 family endo-1,4-beta-xylanase